jgi:SAM-dependent methyltransferase
MNRTTNFDRVARAYRWMEAVTFGPLLMQARCAYLGEVRGCKRALVLGDGDGRFTRRLLAANGAVRVDAVDASAAMLAELRRNAEPYAGRVCTYVADARLWQPARAAYDAIATHFFLDCLTTSEVAALAVRVRSAAAPGALWVVSEFAIPRGAFGAVVARPVVALLYRVFSVLTGLTVQRLPEYRAALAEAGFVLAEERPRLRGLLVSELWRTP